MRKEINYNIGQTIGNCIYNGECNKISSIRLANFICVCGNEFVAPIAEVKMKRRLSCGCLNKKKGSIKHGNTANRKASPEYRAWLNMRKRCYYAADISYPNYGGRGVTVCDRWLESFENFYADMGDRPSNKHSLDKDIKAKELGIEAIIYSPEMCCWATPNQQRRYQRERKALTILEIQGKKIYLKEFCAYNGLSYTKIRYRLKVGWGINNVFSNLDFRRA